MNKFSYLDTTTEPHQKRTLLIKYREMQRNGMLYCMTSTGHRIGISPDGRVFDVKQQIGVNALWG